jgi:hypothetical protein
LFRRHLGLEITMKSHLRNRVNMKNLKAVTFLSLTIVVTLAGAINPTLAHSFNVALVVPQSGTTSGQGREIVDGFMLATEERDSHPDQESDGHLGGLDVYVIVIEENGDTTAMIEGAIEQGEVDIVAIFVSDKILSLVREHLDRRKVALLLPGQSPFAKSDLPEVAVFKSAYERKYSAMPSIFAAQGYNVARRIDAAVRAQSGVGNKALLNRTFRQTAQGFAW